MRTTRRTTASLAAVLSAAVLGAPSSALASGDGQAAEAPVPQPAPTWPVNPQVIPRTHEVAADPSGRFDWDSAGIGAATVLGAFALGTTGVAVVRRRRIGRLSLPSH